MKYWEKYLKRRKYERELEDFTKWQADSLVMTEGIANYIVGGKKYESNCRNGNNVDKMELQNN